jgi:hypothetical protein
MTTIRVSVRPGDLNGLTVLTAGTCVVATPSANHFVNGDAALAAR